jgi:thiamine-monophosphate kinase
MAVGEIGFLARLFPRLPTGRDVLVGPGDDCAVVAVGSRRLLLTTDALVEGVHFRPRWLGAYQLGRRAYLVNASDIAAMGGRPRFVLVSVSVPPRYLARDLFRLHEGIAAAAAETGARIVGGNVTRADVLSVSITLIGDMRGRPVLRRGARPGDALFVTGDLGTAALGRLLISRHPRTHSAAAQRFREPTPRLRAGSLLARHGVASAMIDVSDGLLRDVGHLCRSSGVGAAIEAERLPCDPRVRAAGYALALSGGEDYELLWTVRPHHVARMQQLQHRFGCQTTRIGRVMPKAYGVRVLDAKGTPIPIATQGFDHFRSPTPARPHPRTGARPNP